MITLNSSQSFGCWQPLYADHHIATFPVRISADGKKPMVSNYGRFGLPASAEISKKYPDATAIGFMAGKRTKLTVLDVDTTAERVLADAQDRHGPSPVIVKSASGKFHAYYRHNGEGRHIRPWPDKPIDLLGGGFVVAPPSRGISGDYQFIQGNLDDLDRLPIMQNIKVTFSPEPISPDSPEERFAPDGRRHKALVRYCTKSAHSCDDLETLIDVARTRNDGYMPPMPDEDVMKIAKWTWHNTETGQNRIGQHGAWFKQSQVQSLARDPYLFALIGWLKAQNGPKAEFWIANGLATAHLGWPLDQLQKTRKRAIELGWIEIIVAAAKGRNALYRWGTAQGLPARSGESVKDGICRENPEMSEADRQYFAWRKRADRMFKD